MVKWADYGIFTVKYNDTHTRIIAVKAYKDLGDKFGQEDRWSKNEVVSAIERGTSFITIKRTAKEQWSQGEDVRIFEMRGVKFIRTDANRTESDNLGELPEF